jgi:hypothetical protein
MIAPSKRGQGYLLKGARDNYFTGHEQITLASLGFSEGGTEPDKYPWPLFQRRWAPSQ